MGGYLRPGAEAAESTRLFAPIVHPKEYLVDLREEGMERSLEQIRMLADTMNYLDHTYCGSSILEWIQRSPEGMAYSIVRRLFIEIVEESAILEKQALRAA